MKITIDISDSVAAALRQHWTQQPIADIIAALAIIEAKECEDLAKTAQEAAQ
jgi:hypothetical protein